MTRRATPESFWARVDKTGGECWTWLGAHFRSGYTRVKYQGHDTVAHLIAYELTYGSVPDGLELDHLCRHRWCVNPAHLEPVPHAVNQARIPGGLTVVNATKAACNRGHSLSGDNLFVRRDGRRRCRTCERATQQRLRSTDAYRQRHAAEERARRARKEIAA